MSGCVESVDTNRSELIASGDKDEVALFKEFNNSLMAAYNLSQAEMNSLLDYLQQTRKIQNRKKSLKKELLFFIYIFSKSYICSIKNSK